MNKMKCLIRDYCGNIYYHGYKKHCSLGNRCLIYHAFGSKLSHDTYGISINISKFNDHIKYLHDNYELTEFNNFSNKSMSVSLSIDDGYKDTIDAVNILDNYGIPFSLFITAGMIGKDNYLSVEDISEIAKLEKCNIGAHGLNHLRLGDLDIRKQYSELNDGKVIIEDITKKKITAVSYPHGSYNNDTLSIISDIGYEWAVCSKKGFNDINTNNYLLKRSEVIATDNINDLTRKLKGYYDYY